jgi:N-acetylated-alpha-linked acidic dipeptidase
MHRWQFTVLLLLSTFALAATPAEEPVALQGFSANAAQAERGWEGKFRSIPSPDNLRDYMKRLSARPHHVGSPYESG